MILKKKETAEQKLLKMIEASSTDGIASSNKAHQKVLKKQDLLTVLKSINKLLLVGIIFVGCLVAFEIKSGMTLIGKDIKISAASKKGSADTKKSELLTIQSLPYYLAGVNRRNIFQSYESVSTAKAPAQEQMNISRQLRNFKLVGISWLDHVDTASVMIEDTDKKITYFLKKGEKIGNIEVNMIYADSVKLGLENEEMILKYEKPQL
ncbi:MAG: hypothetical protein KBD53_03900 [Candidatus Omnitrophica bacterium]|nr:hypothetical protein [Candidatus Omnitrophota bacterium]